MQALSLLMPVAAYLVGSVSTAIIVCKVMRLPDPRQTGSGNPGATNVLRVGGKGAAAVTLAGDALKGFLPVLIATRMGLAEWAIGATAIAAVLGHVFPIFFKQKTAYEIGVRLVGSEMCIRDSSATASRIGCAACTIGRWKIFFTRSLSGR